MQTKITLKAQTQLSEPKETTTLIGKDFYKLPAVMMVEGAYTPYVEDLDTKTTLLFTGTELQKSVFSWNGRPVSINHPDNQETCNCPENYQKQWIGFVFNTRYDSYSKALKADVWVELERGESIVSMAKGGEELDISIGAYGDIVPVSGQTDKGIEYSHKMENITGDHLAVLPGGVGACSWQDGCGIRANKFISASQITTCVLAKARKPSYSGVETTSWGGVKKTVEAYLEGYRKRHGGDIGVGSDVSKLSDSVKSWIASKTLLGDPKAKTERDLIFFPVVNPSSNKLNEGALRAVLSGRGASADIPETAKKSARDKAELLLKEHFKTEENMSKEEVKADVAASNCVSEGKQDKKEKEQEKPKVFDMESWLNTLPLGVKDYMITSMKSYEHSKKKHIDKIKIFSSREDNDIDFCEKELSKITDMSVLENIAKLTDLASLEKDIPNEVNYQLNGSSVKASSLGYAEFKDISWDK